MQFYDDGLANGGFTCNRRELLARIEALYNQIDGESERREELLCTLRRTERAIARWKELIEEMETCLR